MRFGKNIGISAGRDAWFAALIRAAIGRLLRRQPGLARLAPDVVLHGLQISFTDVLEVRHTESAPGALEDELVEWAVIRHHRRRAQLQRVAAGFSAGP